MRNRAAQRPAFPWLRALFVGGLAILAIRSVGFARDVLMSARFGAGSESDQAFAIIALVTYFTAVLSGGFVHSYVPIRARLQSPNSRRTAVFERDWMNLVLFGSVGIGVLLALLAPFMLKLFGQSGKEAASGLSWIEEIIIGTIVATQIYCAGRAAQFTAEQRSNASLLPTALPPIGTIALLLLIDLDARSTVLYGLLAGILAQMLLVEWLWHRGHSRCHIAWPRLNDHIASVLRLYFPVLMSQVLQNSSDLINQLAASRFGPGALSTVNFAYKPIGLLLAVPTTLFAIVLLPRFSKSLENNGTEKAFADVVWISLVVGLMTSVGCTTLFFLADHIVHILYERGRFDAQDAAEVANLFRFYLIHVPVFTVAMIFVTYLSAARLAHHFPKIAAVNLVTHVAALIALAPAIGLTAIPVALLITYSVSGLQVLHILGRFNKGMRLGIK